MSERYFGFEDSYDVARTFEEGSGSKYGYDEKNPFVPAEDFPKDEEILLAVYETGSYEGSAYVLFRKDGNLYEVEGSHCSCNGLEGQWSPGIVTPESLALRIKAKANKEYIGSNLSDPEVWAVYESTVAGLLEGRA